MNEEVKKTRKETEKSIENKTYQFGNDVSC